MKQYRLAKCLGDENVTKALEEIPADGDPEWELHSVVPSGITKIHNNLDPRNDIVMMTFLVIFQREVYDA